MARIYAWSCLVFWLSLGTSLVSCNSAVLTSDIGGSNSSISICPNEIVILTCNTSTGAVAWLYGVGPKVLTTLNDVQGDGIILDFRVAEISGSDISSTGRINTTMDITVACNDDGANDDNTNISISVIDTPPPPSNVSVVDVQLNLISLEWATVPNADSYLITITPPPIGGTCGGGSCISNTTNIIIDQLAVAEYTICISSMNCPGTASNCTTIVQDNIPQAIVDVEYDSGFENNDTSSATTIVCPNDYVNITCQAAGGLAWFVVNTSISEIYRVSISVAGESDEDGGYTFTLLENDGVELSSMITTKANSSFQVICSPTAALGAPDNTIASITVLETLPQPQNLMIVTSCRDYIELQWTNDRFADGYMIEVTPAPTKGVCLNGKCNTVTCDGSTCIVTIDGLAEFTEYLYTVSGFNCAGNGQPSSISHLVSLEEPPKLELISPADILNDNERENTFDYFLEWKPPSISCTTPLIDNYIIVVSSLGEPDYYNTQNCCNFTIERLQHCGLYTFTVYAVNSVDRGLSSLPVSVFSGTPSQSISVTRVTYESVVISITVSKCLIHVISEITVELSRLTNERVQEQTYFGYMPSLNITNLEDDVEYNVTITVFYKKDNSTTSLLTPITLRFTTLYNLFSLTNITIGSLAGLSVLGFFICILIIVIGIFCLREARRRKQLRKALEGQRKIRATQKNLEKDVSELREDRDALRHNVARLEELGGATVAATKPSARLYPELVEYSGVTSPDAAPIPEKQDPYSHNTYL